MGAPSLGETIYVVDTDSWIELHRHYKQRTFGTLWQRLDALALAGRLLVAEQVQRELRDDAGEDPVRFLQDHPEIVRSTAELWARASEVANRFRDLIDLAKPQGSADPFVVALALEETNAQRSTLWPCPVVLVTQENRKRPGRIAIPDACDDLGIKVLKLQGMFEAEGWQDL